MEIEIGTKGLKNSWQAPFPETTKCPCEAEARIAFVATEGVGEKEYVSTLHRNECENGYWPHDAIAVAVYFCKKCFKPVVLWNQG